jgi:Tetratricopeptide repeat
MLYIRRCLEWRFESDCMKQHLYMSYFHYVPSDSRQQGRVEEASKEQKDVLEMRKRILGEEHPDIFTSTDVLSWTWATRTHRGGCRRESWRKGSGSQQTIIPYLQNNRSINRKNAMISYLFRFTRFRPTGSSSFRECIYITLIIRANTLIASR